MVLITTQLIDLSQVLFKVASEVRSPPVAMHKNSNYKFDYSSVPNHRTACAHLAALT